MTKARCTFLLSQQTVDLLKRVAEDEGITMSEIIRRAIRTEKFILDTQAAGDRFLIQNRAGQVREVLLR